MKNSVQLSKSQAKWAFKYKLARFAWQYLVQPLVVWIPFGGSRLRIGAWRLFGARIGSRCLIMRGARCLCPWNLELADFVAIGFDVMIYNHGRVEVGSNTVISQYAHLCTSTHDYTSPSMPLTWSPISIGGSVWICAGAFVGPGVRVGDGAILGANAVAMKDVPDWTVCVGNPCHVIKPRTLNVAHEGP